MTPAQRRVWPDLADDLTAARQMILSVALSEMTHMRWDNQILWLLHRAGHYPKGTAYKPVIRPVPKDRADPPRSLQRATLGVIQGFVDIERPRRAIDTEYARLVHALRQGGGSYPEGLYELAVRIDSDGLQHFQKFRDVALILSRYAADESLFLRPITLAGPDDDSVAPALALVDQIVDALTEGYAAEAADDMRGAEAANLSSRTAMRDLMAEWDRLARDGIGLPIFARWRDDDA